MSQRTVINVFETIQLVLPDGKTQDLRVKVDTGAYRSSLDAGIAEKLGLYHADAPIGEVLVKSALGKHKRPVIHIEFVLGGHPVKTTASLSDRSKLKFDMIIGRRDLKNYAVEYRPEDETDHGQLKLPSSNKL